MPAAYRETTMHEEMKAEGDCLGLPYNTELVNANGCTVHFWCGASIDQGLLERAIRLMRSERDIVGVTCSTGAPAGYWAHQDLPRQHG